MGGLATRISMRQSQSLALSPQIIQAIRILQMSRQELDAFIAGEIDQNPLLEDNGTAASDEAPADPAIDESPAEEIAVDADPADVFPDEAIPATTSATRSAGPGASDDLGSICDRLEQQESLVGHIEQRIAACFADRGERMVALSLLSMLDPCGYLTERLEVTAKRTMYPLAEVEAILLRCQQLAPSGVFARTLSECLSLQLAERNRLDPAMQCLLDNLDLVAAGRIDDLCGVCGVDRADVREMIAEVKALDPKPGLAFAPSVVTPLIPDVFVRPAPGGGWRVELNDDALPRLIVNRSYYATVTARPIAASDRKYLAESLQKASWLEKSLDQRARTILKVASEIVSRQAEFLARGVSGLQPLSLGDLADALHIHKSTVSRAVSNKTIATPRGMFEMRYFFGGAVGECDGTKGHSAEAVKYHIRQIISTEKPGIVLSDGAIATRLAAQRIMIARRTVAKYREEMQIASSVERRRKGLGQQSQVMAAGAAG
jgi:RNA polymerase sigma-54 factor